MKQSFSKYFLKCNLLLIISIIVASCNSRLIQGTASSYQTQNISNNLIIYSYNAERAIDEIFCIQSTAVAGFSYKIKFISYTEGESIQVGLDKEFNQIFIVNNQSGRREEGKTSLKFVDGIAHIKILTPTARDNEEIVKVVKSTITASLKDCDKACTSGGCGSINCSSSMPNAKIPYRSDVSCRDGYFACCSDISLFISSCKKNSCCKK